MSQIILIIDDNALNLDVMAQLVKREGFEPIAVANPRHLNAVLEVIDTPRLVFLDIEFPNADGMKLIHTMREHPNLAAVRIVAYSVHTSELNEAREAGFDGFLGKPLSVERFPEQLRRILAGEPVWEVSL